MAIFNSYVEFLEGILAKEVHRFLNGLYWAGLKIGPEKASMATAGPLVKLQGWPFLVTLVLSSKSPWVPSFYWTIVVLICLDGDYTS